MKLTSDWIKALDREFEYKKIFFIDGHIDDDFYYDGRYFKDIFDLLSFKYEASNYNVYFYPDEGNVEEEQFYFINKLLENSINPQNIHIVRSSKRFFTTYHEEENVDYFIEKIILPDNLFKIIFVEKNFGEVLHRKLIDNKFTYVKRIQIKYPNDEIRKVVIRDIIATNSPEIPNLSAVKKWVKLTSSMKLKEIKEKIDKAERNGNNINDPELQDDVITGSDGELFKPWEKLSINDVNNIYEKIKKRVIGQDRVLLEIKMVLKTIVTGFNNILSSNSSKKPKAVFLFVGPSGVGKTETAKALSEYILGSESNLIRFDMSEYKDKISFNKLIGPPPGYVGYEEGSILVNKVLATPYNIILFDEIEKAHTDIWDLFLQIFDDGRFTDPKNNTAYFDQSIIILTSNIGNIDAIKEPDDSKANAIYKESVKKYLNIEINRSEMLNRIGENRILVFNRITDNNIKKKIVFEKLNIIEGRLQRKYSFERVKFSDKLVDFFVSKIDESFGARGIDKVIEQYIGIFLVEINEEMQKKKKLLIDVDFKMEKLILSDEEFN